MKSRLRLSRLAARGALIGSAISLCVAALLVVEKFAPPLRSHWNAWHAQRAILALPWPSAAYEYPTSTTRPVAADASDLARAADAWFVTVAGTLAPARANPNVVYCGPLRDSAGRDRLICVRVFPSGYSGLSTLPAGVFIECSFDRQLSLFGMTPPNARGAVLGLIATAASLHVDPPHVDPQDDRRLLLTGVADGRPFSFELTINANDVLSCLSVARDADR